ncbi:MAG: DUF488 domain-containing protein [Gemmataceae bacterium]|nr:DUF488 domain-containing protein [Gemmataceae bacterium]
MISRATAAGTRIYHISMISDETPTLLTVGHSNHTVERFLGILHRHGIEVLVDVRSRPFSKYVPHFNQPNLEPAVRAAGLQYLYMGDQLGGMPADPTLLDADGLAVYDRIRTWPAFVTGIERLDRGIRKYCVAIMCAEENPAHCHRHRLVSRAMDERGVRVRHVRADGTIMEFADVPLAREHQPTLFD